MKQPRWASAQSTQALPPELRRLSERIETLPDPIRRELRPLFNQVIESTRMRRRVLAVAKDALEQLRLDLKFVKFDRDMTRLEKDQLLRRLEEE